MSLLKSKTILVDDQTFLDRLKTHQNDHVDSSNDLFIGLATPDTVVGVESIPGKPGLMSPSDKKKVDQIEQIVYGPWMMPEERHLLTLSLYSEFGGLGIISLNQFQDEELASPYLTNIDRVFLDLNTLNSFGSL